MFPCNCSLEGIPYSALKAFPDSVIPKPNSLCECRIRNPRNARLTSYSSTWKHNCGYKGLLAHPNAMIIVFIDGSIFITELHPSLPPSYPHKIPSYVMFTPAAWLFFQHIVLFHILSVSLILFGSSYAQVYKSSSKRKAHIMKAHPGLALPPGAR